MELFFIRIVGLVVSGVASLRRLGGNTCPFPLPPLPLPPFPPFPSLLRPPPSHFPPFP